VPGMLRNRVFFFIAGEKILAVLRSKGLGSEVVNIVVVDEPHKRWSKSTEQRQQQRERHKHAVIHMRNPWAWINIQKELHKDG